MAEEKGGEMVARLNLTVNICIGPDCLKVGYDVMVRVEYSFKKGYDSPFGQSQDFKFKINSAINLHNKNGCVSSHNALSNICWYYAHIFENENSVLIEKWR